MGTSSSEDLVPVVEIMARARCLNAADQVSRDEAIFCYESVLRAIQACLKKKYHCFDGHTSTQCCHGIAMLARDLLSKVPWADLQALSTMGQTKLKQLETLPESASLSPSSTWRVPSILIDLAALHVIAFSSEYDDYSGRRVAPLKLRSLAPLGRKICGRISRRLQRQMSNRVARRYSKLLARTSAETLVAGIPVGVWGKYVAPAYLREDNEGRLYASHLYSMQVTIAHLVHSRSKVLILNDLIDKNNQRKGRYLQLLIGNGRDRFVPIEVDDNSSDDREPVAVLAGCCYSDVLSYADLTAHMRRWHQTVDQLILACEAHCEQFPTVATDSNFDSTPLNPSESALKTALARHRNTKGVSVKDPSLFCLFHVYLVSLAQTREAFCKDAAVLPSLPISGRLRGLPKAVEKKGTHADLLRNCA